jgi:DNA/RNA endonuclease G (NUC1)
MIAFHFACYGGGTPRLDDFPHLRQLSERARIAPRAFVAQLPQRLLGHPNGGALAVVGHVERAWSSSFHGGARLGEQLQVFQSTLSRLLDGLPIGWAMEYFNGLHAALGAELSQVLTNIRLGEPADNWELSSMWTANNDARSYLVLGDPAVRLSLADTPSDVRRPAAGALAISPRPVESAGRAVPASGEVSGKAAVESEPGTSREPSAYPARVKPDTITLTVPVRITIQVGSAGPSHVEAEAFAAGAAAISIDSDYGNREGYDPEFLGGGPLSVPLAGLSETQRRDAARVDGAEPEDDACELKYHHFSLVMNRRRRLPFFTAVNIDGRTPRSPERDNDRSSYDPRVDRNAQIGNELYGRPFDRGHLVRRLDPAWGRTRRMAKAANDDTFHWTNCSPQHFRFNEGKNLWAGLEDYLLQKAGAERKRLTVFTGPVFEADDPEYREVLIPKRFWKVAVLARDGALAALGFLVSQEALLRDFLSFGPQDVARTFQLPIRRIEKATGLRFGTITDLDALSVTDFTPGGAPERELFDFDAIRIPV